MIHSRIYFRRLTLLAFAGLLLVSNVWAQKEQVRNWAAPLYWQPSARESALIKRAQSEAQGLAAISDAAAGTPDTSATPVSPLVFVAITPCRMMDTRGYDATFTGVYGPPAMAANDSRALPVAGVTAGYCNVPGTAEAVSINVTLWPNAGSPVSYLTIWPTGSTFPTVSTLNDTEGVQGVNNGAVAALGTGGAFSFYVTNPTNLFIDVNGYYAAIGDANGNTTLGIGALPNNTGSDNTATGYDALQANTNGSGNTANGYDALLVNTTGAENTASGYQVLRQNTTGVDNTASGYLAMFQNTIGSYNTASGYSALAFNTAGNDNTATGSNALYSNTTGSQNTASGVAALGFNTTGGQNTATGSAALQSNTIGSFNTAAGYAALQSNTIGSGNTASGYLALQANTSGNDNTAHGDNALWGNTTGTDNTATGIAAMELNTSGLDNTASGAWALYANTTGNGNTAAGAGALAGNTIGWANVADGYAAMNANTTGYDNTASGNGALTNNITGWNNIALGYQAGFYVFASNSNNIHIGSVGASGDSGTIRIGGSTTLGDPAAQTQFFASGIRGTTTVNSDAVAVMIDSAGQLGTVSSSRTVKRDIEDMGDTTGTLMSLRPVRFRYKVHGPDSPLQYGLVAEEVAEVAPDLVARNKDGEIETVFYDKVNAMMLNELQAQRRIIEGQKEQMQSQKNELTGRMQSQQRQFTDRLQAQGELIRQFESRLADIENRVK